MPTANEYLKNILNVVVKIEQNQRQLEAKGKEGKRVRRGVDGSIASKLGSAVKSFVGVRPAAMKSFFTFLEGMLKIAKESKDPDVKKLKIISESISVMGRSLPSMAEGLGEMGKLRTTRIKRALHSLQLLYNFMEEAGDPRKVRKVERGVKTFEKMGKALRGIARPLRAISGFLLHLGVSILAFVGSIVIASLLLKLSSPLGIIPAIIGIVVGLATFMGILTLISPFIKPGIWVIKGIGKGFAFLSLGLLGFTLSLLIIAGYLGVSKDGKGIWQSLLILGGVIALVVGMMVLLGLANKLGIISGGVKAISKIGVGLLIFTLGIFTFALGMIGIATLLGASKDGKGIALAMGMMALTIAGIVGIFYLLGRVKKQVAMGTLVAILVAAGITAIAFSMIFLAKAAAQIGLSFKGEKGKEKMKFLGKEVSPAIASLGMIGMIFIGSAALFALIGIPVVAGLVALGAATAIIISLSLYTLAVSVQKLVKVSDKIPENFSDNLKNMIGGLLQGVTEGITLGLTGRVEKGGGRKLFAALKNTAILMGGLGMLFSVSLTLSMFAKALTAFAELDNMRVITGYDKDGKPKFGEKIDISQVSQNINISISTFLTALIESTTKLTRKKAKALKKMGRALTGRRGILSAIIAFSSVLKTYAEFGPAGEIGFVELQDTGKKDLDGQSIYKEVKSEVKITDVVKNIINSFSKFVSELTSKADIFGVGRKEGKKMKRLAEVLLGKKGRKGKEKYGLLQPIQTFAETLTIYAKYGKDLKIPMLDVEGKEVGKPVSVKEIAGNIIKTLTAFTAELGTKKIKTDTKAAEKNLKVFDNIITKVNKIAKSTDGLVRLSSTIKEFSANIALLSTSLINLDTTKLQDVSNIGAAYLAKTNDYSVSNKRIAEGSLETTTTPRTTRTPFRSKIKEESRAIGITTKSKEPNWDDIAAQIGIAVGGQLVTAIKSGQMKFEFSPTGTNQGVIEFD